MQRLRCRNLLSSVEEQAGNFLSETKNTTTKSYPSNVSMEDVYKDQLYAIEQLDKLTIQISQKWNNF